MAWTAPMTAIANSVFTAAQFNTFVRDNLNETAPAKATTSGRYFVATGVNSIAERASSRATVGAGETTTSATYTSLATPGPSVTVTSGSRALVMVNSFCNNDTAGTSCSFSYSISGATTQAADDADRGVYVREGNTTGVTGGRLGTTSIQSALTPGSNTFTMEYKTSGGTATFSARTIVVFPY